MPLLFSEPVYPWVYKHVGVVEYIDLHGRLDASVDIYQNWPAFFTLSAWFGRVAGTRPLEYAAWAQVFFNACNLVLLRYVFGSLSRDVRLVWTAVFVFFSANWVAQDYFSPQAFAFMLSLGFGVFQVKPDQTQRVVDNVNLALADAIEIPVLVISK